MKPHAIANLFKALSSERKVQILELLLRAGDEAPTVSMISEMTGIPQGQVSWNLGKLSDVGLVIGMPHGTWVMYKANRTIIKSLTEFLQTGAQDEGED